ncbi:unnamed protein product [Prunus armeniaca]
MPNLLSEILENLYCLSKRGVVVHPKGQLGEAWLVVVMTGDDWQWSAAVVEQVRTGGPAVAYRLG